jgi:hypothetical protein|uniref:DUF3093 domain-containing protein n=1 Tax=Candidatus Planktophila sp. TaxID=2175601 RepID=UPI00404930F3
MVFREVIRPPLWVLAFIYFLFLSLVIAIWAALDNRSALISWIAATLGITAIAIRWRTEITVDDKELRIGGAHIELKYLKEVSALSAQEMRLMRTRDADPAAFLALAFWIPAGVKIVLNDDRDNVPYWLISVRKSEELTRTLYKLL